MTVDLSHLEEDFSSSEEKKASNFDPLPDGKYIVEVDQAELTTSRSGSPMLKWTLRVLQGPFDNRLMWRNNMLASKENLGWLKADLTKCGLTLAKVNDLNERAGELVGCVLEVTQKTNGQFTNVYINRMLTDDEVTALTNAAAAPPIDPNDVTPF